MEEPFCTSVRVLLWFPMLKTKQSCDFAVLGADKQSTAPKEPATAREAARI